MSGLKPLLHSNPKTAIAFQLLGYPVAFTNTVLKGAAKQLVKDPVRNTAKVMTAATIMTGMARWTNYVRTGGESERGKDLDDILYSSIARWGGNGILLDTFSRAQKTAMYSQNPAAYAAMPFGPIASDTLNLFQQGIVPVVGQKLPFYTAFAPAMDIAGLDGKDRMRTYRKTLKDVQRRLSENVLPKFEKSAPVLGYAKGGEVEVPNAPAEPDERIDKLTGLPYNEQAGEAYTDQEDRLQFNKGGVTKPQMSDIFKAIVFSAGSLASEKEVSVLSNKIENQLSSLEVQGLLDLNHPKTLSYIKSLVVNSLEAPEFKSINDLEKIPSWKKAVEVFNDEKLWEQAQKDLGVTNKQQVALETIAKSSEEVDPEGAIDSVVTPMLSSLAYKLRKSNENKVSDNDTLKKMNMAAGGRVRKSEGGEHVVHYGRDAVNEVVKREGALTPEQEYVVKHEGFVDGEYKDTKGIVTSGVGQTGEFIGRSFKETYEGQQKRVKEKIPNYDNLSANHQKALMSLGYRGDMKKDYKWVELFNKGEYDKAAIELLNHKEYLKYKKIAREGGDVSGIIGRLEEASELIKG
tara:strand:- start:65 stop:1789 length:1725 start_codon:yes stop_codon:yes gene_type:complete